MRRAFGLFIELFDVASSSVVHDIIKAFPHKMNFCVVFEHWTRLAEFSAVFYDVVIHNAEKGSVKTLALKLGLYGNKHKVENINLLSL